MSMKVTGPSGDAFSNIKTFFKSKVERFMKNFVNESSSKIVPLSTRISSESTSKRFSAKPTSTQNDPAAAKVEDKAEEILNLDKMMRKELEEENKITDFDEMMATESNNEMVVDLLVGETPIETISTSIGWVVQGSDVKVPLQEAMKKIEAEQNPQKKEQMKQKLAVGAKLIAAKCFVGPPEKREIACEKELIAVAEMLRGKDKFEIMQLLGEKGIPKMAQAPKTVNKPLTLASQLSLVAKGQKPPQLVSQIAQDMKNAHMQLFQAVDVREFSRLAWSKTGKEVLAPNLVALPALQNRQIDSMANSILFNENGKLRTLQEAKNMISFYMDLLDECIKEHDYFAAQTVFGVLSNASIYRIFANDDPTMLARLNPATELFNPAGNSKNLVSRIQTDVRDNSTYLPTPLILTRLTFIHEPNADKKDHFFSEAKMKLLDDQLSEFTAMQRRLSSPGVLQTNLTFSSQAPSNDQAKQEASLKIKPRQT